MPAANFEKSDFDEIESSKISSLVDSKTNKEFSWLIEENSIDSENFQLDIDEKALFYRKHFHLTEHFNWSGHSETEGPLIISFKYSAEQNQQRRIVAILRTRKSTLIENLDEISSSSSIFDILRRICLEASINDAEFFDPIIADGTQKLLTKFDESLLSNEHKFGIIYQKENQTNEDDIFSNEFHSSTMEKFLDFLGQRVKLKDFRGYRAGLDVKSDFTGTESLYEQFQDHQIMFHVSTFLPHSKTERQQLERKRHIGNDIAAIVFQERETVFNPEWITSQFLHVYVVISPTDDEATQFKVSVVFRDSVPPFGPKVEHSGLMKRDENFKRWLLTKLINGQMASCRSATFEKFQSRTKKDLFENLYKNLRENNRQFMNFILFYSQFKHEFDVEQQQKEEIQHSTGKGSERHVDNSLLGSMRRRFTTKSRPQTSSSVSSSTTNNASSSIVNNKSELKSRTRTNPVDIKQNLSKEQSTNQLKTLGLFSSIKGYGNRAEKSKFLDAETNELWSNNTKSNVKYLSATASDGNFHRPAFVQPLSIHFHTSSSDEVDEEPRQNLLIDELQTMSKEDLIKTIQTIKQNTEIVEQNSMQMNTNQNSGFTSDPTEALNKIYGNSL